MICRLVCVCVCMSEVVGFLELARELQLNLADYLVRIDSSRLHEARIRRRWCRCRCWIIT